MSDPTIAITFHEACTQEYRRAVARFGSKAKAVNRQDAMAHANEAIRERIHSGELELPIDDAIHAALTAADGRDGQAADKILSKLANGEIGLDIWPDPLLDVVVTLGGGRRKAWRHVTVDDLTDMANARADNAKAARRAERRFAKDVQAVYEALLLAGSVGRMVLDARKAVA